jgi:hypothetical protein
MNALHYFLIYPLAIWGVIALGLIAAIWWILRDMD